MKEDTMETKRLKRIVLQGVIVVLAIIMVFPFAFADNNRDEPAKQLKISYVYVDFSQNSIFIEGQNFPKKNDHGGEHSAGNAPVVKLGGTNLVIVGFTEHGLQASLPPRYVAGDYLLTVSKGNADMDYDEYDLTIGGAMGPRGLKGDAGPQGPAGPQGATGPRGSAGSIGAKGDKGAQGLQGVQGPAGPAGATGATGAAGADGAAGAAGKDGADGAPGTITTVMKTCESPAASTPCVCTTPKDHLMTYGVLCQPSAFIYSGGQQVEYHLRTLAQADPIYIDPNNSASQIIGIDATCNKYAAWSGTAEIEPPMKIWLLCY
jgi:hypothetical protein